MRIRLPHLTYAGQLKCFLMRYNRVSCTMIKFLDHRSGRTQAVVAGAAPASKQQRCRRPSGSGACDCDAGDQATAVNATVMPATMWQQERRQDCIPAPATKLGSEVRHSCIRRQRTQLLHSGAGDQAGQRRIAWLQLRHQRPMSGTIIGAMVKAEGAIQQALYVQVRLPLIMVSYAVHRTYSRDRFLLICSRVSSPEFN